MVFSVNNNEILTKGVANVGFSNKNSTRATNDKIKIPEIKDSFIKKADKSKDGKFSYLEFGKNIAKGTGKFFTDIVKNIVQHPIMSLGTMAVFGAMACTPLGLSLLAGMGLTTTLFSGVLIGVNSAKLAKQGKWDELEKKGTEIGKLIPATILSAIGAVKGIKMVDKAAGLKNSTGVMKSLKKAAEVDARASWAFIKTPFKAMRLLFKDRKVFWQKLSNQPFKNFKNKVKAGYKKEMEGINLDKNLFTKAEKKFLLSKEAKLFNWKYNNAGKASTVVSRELSNV